MTALTGAVLAQNALSAADLPQIGAPAIEYGTLSPVLAITATALIGVLVEAGAPRRARFGLQSAVAIVGILAALAATVWVSIHDLGKVSFEGTDLLARGKTVAEGALVVDGPTVFLWGLLLVFALVSMLMFAERGLEGGLSGFTGQAAVAPGGAGEREATMAGIEHTEIFPLAMFALLGMMVFPASNDLLTMFVALEVLSLPLYLLCGLARRRRLLSQEAAVKYFLLGAFSSAFFLYGIALVYGYSGSFTLAAIDTAVSNQIAGQNLLLAGMALISVGLLFKVSAVPFQAWTPDVYQGAPTAVTAFMAAGTKVAAFGALLRVFFVGFGGAQWDWRPLMMIVAVLTMVVGAVVLIRQTDVKRMLAYSAIAHSGFILTAFAGAYEGSAGTATITSVSAVMFYLAVYGFSTIGAFAIATLVRDGGGEVGHLARWSGLGRESPVLAGVFALFMLSFAGIPLTAGFMGKWTVFSAAWSGYAWPLVVAGVLTSAVAAYFYVRVIVLMFFADPEGDGPTVAVPSVMTSAVIAVTAAVTIVLGIVPGPVLDLAQNAGTFVR